MLQVFHLPQKLENKVMLKLMQLPKVMLHSYGPFFIGILLPMGTKKFVNMPKNFFKTTLMDQLLSQDR